MRSRAVPGVATICQNHVHLKNMLLFLSTAMYCRDDQLGTLQTTHKKHKCRKNSRVQESELVYPDRDGHNGENVGA